MPEEDSETTLKRRSVARNCDLGHFELMSQKRLDRENPDGRDFVPLRTQNANGPGIFHVFTLNPRNP